MKEFVCNVVHFMPLRLHMIDQRDLGAPVTIVELPRPTLSPQEQGRRHRAASMLRSPPADHVLVAGSKTSDLTR